MTTLGKATWGSLAVLVAAATVNADECFDRFVRPSGWRLPFKPAKAESSGVFEPAGAPNIRFVRFKVPPRPFAVPRYYVKDGALVLDSPRFTAEVYQRLEVDGIPFAYTAVVRGVDIGSAGSVWWLDRDQNGSFEELAWNPDVSRLPEWVKARRRGNR